MAQSAGTATLRAMWQAFTHDSMQGRFTGTRGAASAASFLENSLRAIGIRPAGDAGRYTQDVPLMRVQIDTAGTMLTDGEFEFSHGVDYQPLPALGAFAFGAREFPAGEVVFGGRMGTPTAKSAPNEVGQYVLLLPPLRANGQPEYQVWNRPDLLAPYSHAKVLLIASLELMPASVRMAADRPHFELKDQKVPKPNGPALVAVSQAMADRLILRSNSVRKSGGPTVGPMYRQMVKTRSPDVAAQNVVAVVEGTDPTLRSEYVVLSAPLDQADVGMPDNDMRRVWPVDGGSVLNGVKAGTGAVALLEIARAITMGPEKPRRSVIFLWTVAQQHGRAGAEWFKQRFASSRGRIVANIEVDDAADVNVDRMAEIIERVRIAALRMANR